MRVLGLTALIRRRRKYSSYQGRDGNINTISIIIF